MFGDWVEQFNMSDLVPDARLKMQRKANTHYAVEVGSLKPNGVPTPWLDANGAGLCVHA
jgi:hypothetical protein